jgi:hypothetical protein
LLTWNGLGFDLDVLAEESGSRDLRKELAKNHVDMMFHVFCEKGFPVGIAKAAEALKIPGKPPGMTGQLAPKYWAKGRHEDVLKYVTQDVRMALQVALKCEELHRFEWMTRKGKVSTMSLAKGWRIVREAEKFPLPDTSWMYKPLARADFLRWLDGA